MANDFFADIAAGGIGGKQELLEEPVPIVYNSKTCKLQVEEFTPLKVDPKMSSKDELNDELMRMRQKYASFLKDYAPKIENYNHRTYIKECILDGNKKVSLPHYGAPLGSAEQIYTSQFYIDKINPNKAIYVCFEGADYKTIVYINDICVGQHEGFFSPFEFDITKYIKKGNNTVKVQLQNDYIFMGSIDEQGGNYEGDKLYAATGIGYDDPEIGWHHCPPGMGIYNNLYIEIRNRIHISDIFVRPLLNDEIAEVWVEVQNADYEPKDIEFDISVYGQNFKQITVENLKYKPRTSKTVGMGDSLTEAKLKASGELGQDIAMPAKKGMNLYKIPIKIENPKIWDMATPYLYQIQIGIYENGEIRDIQKQQFGMMEFRQDTAGKSATLKGMFYLNNNKIRLRGANTMGFEQLDVLKKDYQQLIDDILLAKICNMNFWRLTQRPVQKEVYEYCDKLGLMTQTDLPLFGCMRRTKFVEGVRQAEEMERHIRSHPCNVIISYINEPFPNAHNQPHRHLEREELEKFFTACDIAVKLNNPDRVIKHVDGDYDPPSEKMPDNHCYPMWYNGHGIDIGRLNKGYWIPVKPGWYYGCGEYGAEGLDFEEVMKEYYPEEWIREPFSPNNIVRAQTGGFHYFFYDTQDNMEDWVSESHAHQAFAIKIMTEAFRRDKRMITNAIHLFIDAWPAGWMKTIMDFKRNPKPAYFEYKNALEPIMLSLRTNRFTYYEGEEISIESYICNDTNIESSNYQLVYELYKENKPIMHSKSSASLKNCDITCNDNIVFTIPKVNDREKLILKAILLDDNGSVLTYNSINLEVFEDIKISINDSVIIIDKLSVGEHEIAGERVVVKPCGMLPLHFVSRNTGHMAVAEFNKDDFKLWYDKKHDMITPLLDTTFEVSGFTPILTSGNMDKNGEWGKTFAVAEKTYKGKRYVICQLDLRLENPIAKRFLNKLYNL